MCSEIVLNNLQRPNQTKDMKRYDTFPAVKLARLAVDKDLWGKGYGQLLVITGMTIMKKYIMPNVGCRFFTVDSKPEAITFYEKVGFSLLIDERNKKNINPLMLFDMNNVV